MIYKVGGVDDRPEPKQRDTFRSHIPHCLRIDSVPAFINLSTSENAHCLSTSRPVAFMDSNTAPINLPSSGAPLRRESNFLSLSPYQSSGSPPKPSTIALHDKKAVTSLSADASAMSAITSSSTNDVAASAPTVDAVSKTRRSSSTDSDRSAIADKARFLKLGHAQVGDNLGDFVEE